MLNTVVDGTCLMGSNWVVGMGGPEIDTVVMASSPQRIGRGMTDIRFFAADPLRIDTATIFLSHSSQDIKELAFLQELFTPQRQTVQRRERSWLTPELENRFRQISELPSNWNSYGAQPIAPWSIAEAKKIVNEGLALGLLAPGVSPSAGAAIGIEWQTSRGELLVDIVPRDGITYLLTMKEGNQEEGVLDDENLSSVLSQLTGFRVE